MKHEGFDLPHAFTAAAMAEALVVIAIFMMAAIITNTSAFVEFFK